MKRAVIIGTGAGGLTAAARLARNGYEVTALERGKQFGGFLNPFKRKRFHFDPGVHYVGQCGAGEMLERVLGAAGVDVGPLFCPMDEDGFDMLRFPGFEMRICAGLDAYEARLVEAFPADRDDLGRFFALLRLAQRALQKRRPSWRELRAVPELRHLTGTFGELLEAMVRNPRLRSVLAGQSGDIGLPPSRTPAILGVGLVLHFAEGAYFPRGGSGALRDALVAEAERHGATFHRNAEVTQIEVRGGRVTAVHTAKGQRFGADVVVSAVDPVLTYGQLLPESDVPARLRRKVRSTEPSVASICIFLGLNRDLRDHGLGAFNVWDYPSWDLDRVYGDIVDGVTPEDWPFFLSPNSLKDDTGTMAPEGASTLEIVTLAPHGPFARWEGQRSFQRSDGYAEAKRDAADSLLASVERRWPGLVGDVVVEDVATPVTNSHYVNAPAGSIYGPASTPDQFGFHRFAVKSPVEGLVLAGAGTLGPGVGSSLASGIVAANTLLKADRRLVPTWWRSPAKPARLRA